MLVLGCRGSVQDVGGDGLPAVMVTALCCAIAVVRARSVIVERPGPVGVCAGCAYDLSGHGESGVCPECGACFPGVVRTRRYSETFLVLGRVPAMTLAIVLSTLALNLPMWSASDGSGLAMADVAWGLEQAWRGMDPEILDRLLRNRAQARARDPSARATLLWILGPAVLWSMLPRWRWRLGMTLAHVVLGVRLSVGLTLLARG